MPSGGNSAEVMGGSLETMFIDIPDLYASPGSVYITGGRDAAAYSALVSSGVIKAHAEVDMRVKIEVFMMTRVGDLLVDDARVARISAATGDYQEFRAGNVYVNDVVSGPINTAADHPSTLSLQIAVKERSHYAYFNAIQSWLDSTYNVGLSGADRRVVPNLGPDVYVLGSVVNQLGLTSITNPRGAIRVSGQLSGLQVQVAAGGDFTISTDWYHVGGNPQLYSSLQALEGAFGSQPVGTITHRTYTASGLSGFVGDRNRSVTGSAVVSSFGAISINALMSI